MRVRDEDGTRWKVRLRWLPWRRRLKTPEGLIDALDLGGGDDPISAIIFAVVALPVIVVLVAVLSELAFLLLLLPFVLVARVLAPVPWAIEVESRPARRRIGGWEPAREMRVRGLRRAWAQRRLTARRLEAGVALVEAVGLVDDPASAVVSPHAAASRPATASAPGVPATVAPGEARAADGVPVTTGTASGARDAPEVPGA